MGPPAPGGGHGSPSERSPGGRTITSPQSDNPAEEWAAEEPLEFAVDLTRNNGHVVVSVQGELDACTGPMLQARLEDAVEAEGGPSIVMDLGAMTFIDSSGLTALVSAHKWLASKQGSLTLSRPTAQTRKILEITGLDRVLTVTG